MVKLANVRHKMVEEMVEGYLELYPKLFKRVSIDRGNCYGIAQQEYKNAVSILIGSGCGNEPWCIGYVGDGLADAAVLGPVYTAPSARAVLTMTRNVPNQNGVVYICTNHAGDVLNFELASELADLEGITTRTVVVTDDVASAPREARSDRRGIAGVLFVVKVAGGAASLGMNVEDVARIAARASDNTYTFCACTSSVNDPVTGMVLLDLEDGMIEYGSGFSGENGLFRREFESVDQAVDTVMRYLLKEIQPLPTDEVAVLVNGFSRVSDMELTLVGRRVLYSLKMNEIKAHHVLIDRVFSPQDGGGFSVTLMCMDEELKRCYDQPAWSPMVRGFMGQGR